MIGDYFETLYIHPFIVLVPITFFALTIISINLILNGLESVYEGSYRKVVEGNRIVSQVSKVEKNPNIREDDFILVDKVKRYHQL